MAGFGEGLSTLARGWVYIRIFFPAVVFARDIRERILRSP